MDRMSRIAPTLLALLLLALALATTPASAASRPRLTEYRLTQAEGFVRMTFRGDEAAGCRERGVCGISGTTTYTFGGKPDGGEIVWIRHPGDDPQYMDGFFITKGETVSDVATAGSPERCVDRVARSFDGMQFEPGRKRVRFDWRDRPQPIGEEDEGLDGSEGADDLRTRCAGPLYADFARALPRATLPYRVFRSKRSKFHLTGSLPFAGGGFAGTVEWDLRYALRYVRSRTGRATGGGSFAF